MIIILLFVIQFLRFIGYGAGSHHCCAADQIIGITPFYMTNPTDRSLWEDYKIVNARLIPQLSPFEGTRWG